MRRVLTLLLSLMLVAAAAAAPAVACVSDTASFGTRPHDCCDEQALAAAPAATCCLVSQPAYNRALTESRIVSHDRNDTLALVAHPAWFQVSDSASPRRRGSTPVYPAPRAVPLYLQQLALLI